MYITLLGSVRIFQFIVVAAAMLISAVASFAQATSDTYHFSHWSGSPDKSTGSADGAGMQARYDSPWGIVIADSGIIYVADSKNSTIRKIAPDGTTTTFVGVAGQTGNADGVGTSARLNNPQDLALDRAGNLYISDFFNYTVRKVTPAGVVTTFVPLPTRLYNIFGLAVDSLGVVYVAKGLDHTINKISPSGEVTVLAGATGQAGSQDGMVTAARFNFPSGLAFDRADNLYVADGLNYTIRKITPSGVVTTLAGTPGIPGSVDGTGAAVRLLPSSLTTDGTGNVYVTDRDVIRKITPAGLVTTLGGKDQQRGNVDGVGSDARFDIPGGVAVDILGNLYIADTNNHVIRKGLRVEVPLPVVTVQPVSQTVRISESVTFSLAATNATSYTWVEADSGLPRETTSSPSWTLSPAYPVNSGNYYVRVTGPGGTIRSDIFTLTVVDIVPNVPNPLVPPKLVNISTRSFVGTGEDVLIAGFIINGTAPKTVLIRASGPALAKFGLSGVLADPTLELRDRTSSLRTNDNWGDDPAVRPMISEVSNRAGAFPFDGGSKDAAMIITLAPGLYTAIVRDKNNTSGTGLVEVYEVDVANDQSKVVNLSSRSIVKTGGDVQIAGFVISGPGPKKVVVRASGPWLLQHGIRGVLVDPMLTVNRGSDVIGTNDNWDSALRADFQKVGSDNWPIGSADAAVVMTLNPGNYTAIVSGKNNTSGVALIEVFDAD